MSIQITIMAQSVNELCGYLGVLANGVPGAIPAENVTVVGANDNTAREAVDQAFAGAVDTLEPGEEIAAAPSPVPAQPAETSEARRRRGPGRPRKEAASKPNGAAPEPEQAAQEPAQAAPPAATEPAAGNEVDLGTDAKDDMDPADPFDAPGTAPPRDPAVDHGLALELLRTLYDKPGLAARVSALLVSHGVAKFSAIPKAKGSELLAQARAIQTSAGAA